ncbi:pyruvate dehydrogenase (acetyl-transferring) E1 component subunit alpha [Candidatus Woesearchaeota archaeon]|nr:pyruvate dehydrogenase (acetyl-transferring) E1 component subunit alpha [Candidatus Woesearchaeota archaeon]
MPRLVIEQYDPLKGQMLQLLDEKGSLSGKHQPMLSDEEALRLYKVMRLCRVMDQKALAMQRQGRMVTYVPTAGQEAASVGAIAALRKEDWVVPAFRETPGQIARGMKLSEVLLWQRGNEQGFSVMPSYRMMPVAVPVGSQTLHAVGISWAMKLRKEPLVAMTFFGDGGTSEGDFHEAMNFAGVFQTPTVFVCQNNQWAISVPRSLQSASKTIAQKALAYGFSGVLVDGNDLFAMHLAAKEAAEKARSGLGPTLIEAFTYRLGAHTTADDPRKYRKEDDVKAWIPRDPLVRLKLYLEKRRLWSEEQERSHHEECDAKVEEAVSEMERTVYEEDAIFMHHFAEMPPHLQEQYEEFRREAR